MHPLTEAFKTRRPMPLLYPQQRQVLDRLVRAGKLRKEHHALLAVFRKYVKRRFPRKAEPWQEECAHSWLHQYLDDETPWQQFIGAVNQNP